MQVNNDRKENMTVELYLLKLDCTASILLVLKYEPDF